MAGSRCAADFPPGPAWLNRIGAAIGAALTFVAVFGAWAIFRADDLPSALRILRGLAGLNGHSLPPSALAEVGAAARWIGQAPFVPSSVGHWIVAHFGAVDAGIPTGMARGRAAGVLISKAQLIWIAGLFAIAWFTPNTRQIMARAEAFIADHPVPACPAVAGVGRQPALGHRERVAARGVGDQHDARVGVPVLSVLTRS